MSIIGNAVLLGGGGGGRATVTINAPKNSTIVYSGPESGTVVVGSVSTRASVVLKKGNYYFESHFDLPDSASTTADTVIYSATVGIAGDVEINLYPPNVLYWYGITSSVAGGWFSKTQTAQTFSEEANSLNLTWSGGSSGGTTQGAFRTVNSISFSGITKIKFRSAYNNRYSSGTYNPTGGYSTSAWTSISGSTNPLTVNGTITTTQYGQEESQVQVSDASGYVGVDAVLTSAIVYAIWLE